MLAVNSVKIHKILALAGLGVVTSSHIKTDANYSKNRISMVDLELSKFKSLVDVRKEWMIKIYPKMDIFQKINNKE